MSKIPSEVWVVFFFYNIAELLVYIFTLFLKDNENEFHFTADTIDSCNRCTATEILTNIVSRQVLWIYRIFIILHIVESYCRAKGGDATYCDDWKYHIIWQNEENRKPRGDTIVKLFIRIQPSTVKSHLTLLLFANFVDLGFYSALQKC